MTGISPSSPPRLTRGKIILILLALISIITISYLFFTYFNVSEYSNMPDIKNSDRILIFAPHPDDESVATAGIIKKAVEKNATVSVVVITDGSGAASPEEFSEYLQKTNNSNNSSLIELRHQEAIDAIKELGLNESSLIFLGYPDAGLRAMFEDYWDYGQPYKSNMDFNQLNHSTYNFTYQKDVPYTGANLVQNVEQIINDFKPTIILYPDGWDEHSDHWATNAFVTYSTAETNYTGQKYTYMVHGGRNWPSPPYFLPPLNLVPQPELKNLDVTWLVVPLNLEEEKAKEEAVDSYQIPLFLTKGYLKSFIRSNELFAIHSPVKVEKVNSTDLFQIRMPNSSFKDVKTDYKTKSLKSADDLSEVGLAQDDQNLYLILNNTASIKSNLLYKFHFRIYNGTEFQRLDVVVRDGKAEYEKKANNSVQPNEKPSVQVQGNMMVLAFPRDPFNDAQFIMMNSDVYDAQTQQLIDFMAWRELKL
jgi:LmbE family N-acetylglucosaminyl deacetylase